MTGAIRRLPAISIWRMTIPRTSPIQVLSLTNIHLRNSVFWRCFGPRLANSIMPARSSTYPHITRSNMPALYKLRSVPGCERDQVADAAKSGPVANLFSRTRQVELPGATHYSFYHCPESVASIGESFFQESRAVASRNA